LRLEMNAWSHLPNAKYIDQVLTDLKAHPDEFDAARDAARLAARDAARSAAGLAARGAAWFSAVDAARAAAWCAAWDEARSAARTAARPAAWAAIAALIAWDSSAKYLTMTYQELNMWYQLNEDPAALLLLPYLKAKELISQKIRT
jgi:hypothetical protein